MPLSLSVRVATAVRALICVTKEGYVLRLVTRPAIEFDTIGRWFRLEPCEASSLAGASSLVRFIVISFPLASATCSSTSSLRNAVLLLQRLSMFSV